MHSWKSLGLRTVKDSYSKESLINSKITLLFTHTDWTSSIIRLARICSFIVYPFHTHFPVFSIKWDYFTHIFLANYGIHAGLCMCLFSSFYVFLKFIWYTYMCIYIHKYLYIFNIYLYIYSMLIDLGSCSVYKFLVFSVKDFRQEDM